MAKPPMEIYQFEDQLERATQVYLLANGINDVAKQRDSKIDLPDGTILTLKVPRVEAKFLCSGLSREHYHPASGMMDMADGVFYLKIVTRRDDKENAHAYLRGFCRYLMQFAASVSALMKYHKIEKIIETQSSTSVDTDRLHDISTLSFQTTLRIRPEWFPIS